MISLENLKSFKDEVVAEKAILETEREAKIAEINAMYDKDISKLDGKVELLDQLIEENEELLD